MAQTDALYGVIRQVPRGTLPASTAETLVTLNAVTGEIEKESRFRPQVHFIVSAAREGQRGAEDETLIVIRDFHSGLKASLHVAYEAKCQREQEATLARSLFGSLQPAAALREKVNRWVDSFINSRPVDFLENYYHRKAALQSHIQKQGSAQAGLDLEVKLLLEGEPPVAVIVLDPLNFDVEMNDYKKEKGLRLKAKLAIDKPNEIMTILRSADTTTLSELIQEQTQEYFNQNISLQIYYYELDTSRVESALTAHLNKALSAWGRKVGSLALESTDQEVIETPFNDTVEAKLEVQGALEPVTISITVRLELEDAAKYKKAGSPPLRLWIRGNLEDIFHDLKFTFTYMDILLNLKKPEDEIRNASATGSENAPADDSDGRQILEDEIRNSIVARAADIGFRIKFLLTRPQLEPLAWTDRFDIRSDEKEQVFQTRYSKYEVKLDILVTVRIPDLRRVKEYLDRKLHVPSEMKKSLLESVSKYMRTIDPGRFYMRFQDAMVQTESRSNSSVSSEVVVSRMIFDGSQV